MWYWIKVATAWAALLVAVVTGVGAFWCTWLPDTYRAGLVLAFICLTSASVGSNISSSLEEENNEND